MAVRIIVGILAALRAVLIYGEAGTLASRPVRVPRLGSAAPARGLLAAAAGQRASR